MAAFTHDVFVSYASADRAVATDLAARLRGRGLRVWFDEWEIEPPRMSVVHGASG
ncbi:MAG: toll/interleukin-1 receptor domain-containing protein [Actinomycetota bacterium]